MEVKTIDEMTEQEFEALLDKIGEAEFDKLTLPSFMDMLWALQAERTEEVIELTVQLVGDNLQINAPEGVLTRGNEVMFDNKRIIVKWANPITEGMP